MPVSGLLLLLYFVSSSLLCRTLAGASDYYQRQERDVGKCSRIVPRREWRTLNEQVKADWITSVKCLASLHHERLSYTPQGTTVSGTHSLYDDFAYSHAALEDTAHVNAYFLPWHRWFLYTFDTALRENCGYSGPTPYWDWSLDVADLPASPIFDPDPLHGLGTTGDCDSDPTSDCLVLDGSFAPAQSNFVLSHPIPHTLRRNLSLFTGWFEHEKPQNATLSLQNIVNFTERTQGDYFRFQHALTQIHNHVHNFIGGDFAGTCPKSIPVDECRASFTPNEPLFWLHHAQLDRLWSKWQNAHPDNFFAFQGFPLNSHNLSDSRYDLNATVTHPLKFDQLSVPVPVSRVFNHSAAPFCYRYVDLTSGEL